jgi:hypothetical protein
MHHSVSTVLYPPFCEDRDRAFFVYYFSHTHMQLHLCAVFGSHAHMSLAIIWQIHYFRDFHILLHWIGCYPQYQRLPRVLWIVHKLCPYHHICGDGDLLPFPGCLWLYLNNRDCMQFWSHIPVVIVIFL